MTETTRTMNSAMARLLVGGEHGAMPLDGRLSECLAAGVEEKGRFVLLKTQSRTAGPYEPRLHFDETGYEWFVNHIHVDPRGTGDMLPLRSGVAYAERLADLLLWSGYPGPFRVIVSYNCEDGVCTVGFHRLREGQSWLRKDLEGYAGEAILVVDC